MARYQGRPTRYQPALQYLLRIDDEGGPVRDPGQFVGNEAAVGRHECLVLVHGYNNHAGEAATAYLGFRDRQYALIEDIVSPLLEKRLGDVFWPGDANWPGPLDWLDFLVYPVAVGTAVETARVLSRLLWRMPNLERIDFIGHSLGCRVVLETISLIYDRGAPVIGRVCLMAAAVPCEMLEPGGRFERPLRWMEASGIPVHVLHSTSDPVVHYAFPPGQALAAEPSFRALGRHGPPPDMPGQGTTVTSKPIAGAGHSDYWGHRDNDAVLQATREAGTFLRIGDQPRPFEPRRPAPPRDLGDARAIGCARPVD